MEHWCEQINSVNIRKENIYLHITLWYNLFNNNKILFYSCTCLKVHQYKLMHLETQNNCRSQGNHCLFRLLITIKMRSFLETLRKPDQVARRYALRLNFTKGPHSLSHCRKLINWGIYFKTSMRNCNNS